MSENDKHRQMEEVISQHEQTLKLGLSVVDRLGVLVKGQDTEVDNKLTKLRKSAASGAELSSIETQLNDANNAVKVLEKLHHIKQKDLRDFLLDAGETLQSYKGMDSDVRRQLRMVVNKLKSKDAVQLSAIQPAVSKMLATYQNLISNGVDKNTKATGSEVKTSDAEFDSGALKRIIERLTKLSRNAVIKPRLSEFRQRVDLATHDLDKLEICLNYFEETVTHFAEEYLQTQKLILNVNAALAEVHKTLIKSIKCSKNYSEQLDQLNKKIDKQINELSKDADQAKDVGKLKSVIDSKLHAITEFITERDEIEARRAAEIDSVLQDMEEKLNNLEQRTEYYRKKWLEEIARADIDALTSLPNRGAYDKRFNEEFKRWLRHPDPLCIAVIDVDHFKMINDKYGHSVGDKTLQIVAKTLRKSLRETDFIARYGGEEFVCLMINTDAKEMLTPLEKLRKAVSSIPFKVKNDRLNITVSVGVTMLLATDNVHTAFDRADKALYEAKNTGRNKICYKK